MKVLHISGDYAGTSVYQQMLMHYSADHSHVMYVPQAVDRSYSRQYDYNAPNIRVIYSKDFHNIDRLFYHRKRRKIFSSLLQHVPKESIDIVHTHYLFAGGGVAYMLKAIANIEYITAVRNSDLNWFFRFAVHLRPFGLTILRKASKVIFISPSYRDQLIDRYVPARFRQFIRDKSVVIPNGVSDFWLNNIQGKCARKNDKEISLLYVGEFRKNKNIDTVIKVLKMLNGKGCRANLTLVGDGPEKEHLDRIASRNQGTINLVNYTDSKEELLRLYRGSDIFVMPSFTETFGLVFVEAMSQGLPIIYTSGQGIDGYFRDGTVGYRCDPLNVYEITDRIGRIIDNYDRISSFCTDAVRRFSWDMIDREYELIYESIGNKG